MIEDLTLELRALCRCGGQRTSGNLEPSIGRRKLSIDRLNLLAGARYAIRLAVELCSEFFVGCPFEIDGIAQSFRDFNRALSLNLRIVRREIRWPENGAAVRETDWKSRHRLIACQRNQIQGGVQSMNAGHIVVG